jgi:cyclophilin family peptidyl-prolyl cis-trans isomerase
MPGAAAASVMVLWSVLVPARQWVAPSQPIEVMAKSPAPLTLLLADFSGSTIAPTASADVKDGQTVDLKGLYPSLSKPGTYLLFAVPTPKSADMISAANFVGTPVVIEVREDKRIGAPAGAMVYRLEPLQYAVMSTDQGEMTLAFYYDAAPVTVDNFLHLAGQGFYDGLTFHTILPGFTIQSGDPKGDGTGGPGYNIDAEFSTRKHEAGVLSMSRMRDPLEDPTTGVGPRQEFANSAGSQFFICLDYKNTQQYDRLYTAFAQVAGKEGIQTLSKIASAPLADAKQGRPVKAPVIRSVSVRAVDPEHNPYKGIVNFGEKR